MVDDDAGWEAGNYELKCKDLTLPQAWEATFDIPDRLMGPALRGRESVHTVGLCVRACAAFSSALSAGFSL